MRWFISHFRDREGKLMDIVMQGACEPDQFTLPIPMEMEVVAAWLLLRWYTLISAEDSSELYQHPISYAKVSTSHWKCSTSSSLMVFPPWVCYISPLTTPVTNTVHFHLQSLKSLFGKKKKGKGSIVMRPYIMLFPINILILKREGHVTSVCCISVDLWVC